MTPPATVAATPLTLLIDTNVLLDVALERQEWVEAATALLDAIARGMAKGYVASHAITTIWYVVQRVNGRVAARTAVNDVLELCTVVPLGSSDFQRALALDLKDYEDAVQAAACLRVGCHYLVSRNPTDFVGAPVVVRAPSDVLPLLR